MVLDSAWTRSVRAGGILSSGPPSTPPSSGSTCSRRPSGASTRWATDGELPARLAIDGFSTWYGMREELWYWLHERILWRLAIADLVASTAADRLEVRTGDPALVDVATALRATGLAVDIDAPAEPPRPPRPAAPPPRPRHPARLREGASRARPAAARPPPARSTRAHRRRRRPPRTPASSPIGSRSWSDGSPRSSRSPARGPSSSAIRRSTSGSAAGAWTRSSAR